jgi:hypothetical protein
MAGNTKNLKVQKLEVNFGFLLFLSKQSKRPFDQLVI